MCRRSGGLAVGASAIQGMLSYSNDLTQLSYHDMMFKLRFAFAGQDWYIGGEGGNYVFQPSRLVLKKNLLM